MGLILVRDTAQFRAPNKLSVNVSSDFSYGFIYPPPTRGVLTLLPPVSVPTLEINACTAANRPGQSEEVLNTTWFKSPV